MEQCAGKKWRSLREIAHIAGISRPAARGVMHNIQSNHKHHVKVEVQKVGNETHYRIFKQDKTVSMEELITKLRPIVEGLKAEGKKNMATMVPAEVAMLAARLERLLNEWAE
jgi:predicted transcriptional regulator